MHPARFLELELGTKPSRGEDVLMGLLRLARRSVQEIPAPLGVDPSRFAATGRIRSTGPGVSFSGAVRVLEDRWPLDLVYPFEGSERVGGAAWVARDLADPRDDGAIAKLHWKACADDLPMHTHVGSTRFIVVLGGRGFFHVSDQAAGEFDGSDVRTIAARRNDVFLFTPGVVHTFSTAEHGMTLLSCHLPFVPLDDPGQYELPSCRWTAAQRVSHTPSRVTATAWAPLVR